MQKTFANPWSRATKVEIQDRSLMSPPTPVPHSLIQLISIPSKFYLLTSSSVLFLSLFLLSLKPTLGPYQFYPDAYNIPNGLPAIILDHLKAILHTSQHQWIKNKFDSIPYSENLLWLPNTHRINYHYHDIAYNNPAHLNISGFITYYSLF